jgi:glutaminyl-tRNA synthetase
LCDWGNRLGEPTKPKLPTTESSAIKTKSNTRAFPGADSKDFIEALNSNSLKVVTAYVEPSLAAAKPDQKFQFERFGYFVADRVDHVAGSKPVFNRVTGLKDSRAK